MFLPHDYLDLNHTEHRMLFDHVVLGGAQGGRLLQNGIRNADLPHVVKQRSETEHLQLFMIRVDDSVTCKSCGKKFDIPSQHSMVFLQASDR